MSGSASLFDLRDFLKAVGPSTAYSLAKHLEVEAQTVEVMLEHWIRRGRVEIVEGGCHSGGLCRTCGACALSSLRWYRWCEGSVQSVGATPPRGPEAP